MNRKRWASAVVLLTVLVYASYASPAFGDHKPKHGNGGSDGLTGPLDVKICLISGTNCVPSSPELHFHVKVIHAVLGSVKGAKVVLTVRDESDLSKVVAVLGRKTGSDGVAHFERKNPGPPEPATYVLSVTATKDEANGTDCLVVSESQLGTLIEEARQCPALPE